MYSKLLRFASKYWLLLVFLLAKMVIQYVVVNPVYDLHRDEFLHLDQAAHLSAGYISVPPLTSWVSALVFLLGGGVFWIRFFPALFGALTMLFAWVIIDELKGGIYAKILVMSALLFSIFVRLNILFQPNAFDILAWTAAFCFLILYIRREQPVWLFMLVFILVLGMYNKYNVIFLIAGLLTGVLFTGERKILVSKYFWMSCAAGFVLLLPNGIWQITHHFPVLHHMDELKSTQLVNVSAGEFLSGQVMYYIGSLLLIPAALISLVVYKPFRPYRLIGIAYVSVIVFFLLLHGKSYYAAGLYPVLFVFGGLYIERLFSGVWKKIVVGFLILSNIAVFIQTFKLIFPVLTPAGIIAEHANFEKYGMLQWEDGKDHPLPQDFADMLGWREMASKSLAVYVKIPEKERSQTLIFCDNYGQAGALNYYNRKQMPESYAFNTDYVFWIPVMDTIRNVLLVGQPPSEDIIKMFTHFEKLDSVTNTYAREYGTGIFLLYGADPGFTRIFYRERERRITDFDIF